MEVWLNLNRFKFWSLPLDILTFPPFCPHPFDPLSHWTLASYAFLPSSSFFFRSLVFLDCRLSLDALHSRTINNITSSPHILDCPLSCWMVFTHVLREGNDLESTFKSITPHFISPALSGNWITVLMVFNMWSVFSYLLLLIFYCAYFFLPSVRDLVGVLRSTQIQSSTV